MTAVNLNALGDLSQVKQPAQLRGTKTTSTKEEFERVMKIKAGNVLGSDGLKVEAISKPPAKRTENKNDSVAKRDSLSNRAMKEVKKSTSEPKTPDEMLAGASEVLGITPEELKAALEALNMNVGDLADRNNAAQLILFLNGEDDISSMLVDNGMLEAFNELNAFVEKTLEANNITADAFKQYLKGLDTGNGEEESLKQEISEENAEGAAAALDAGSKLPEISIEDRRNSSGSSAYMEQSREAEAARDDYREAHLAAAETFMKNLELAAEKVTDLSGTETDIREIVYQVVQRIKVQLSADATSLEMRLNPENLGRVSINIESKGGVMTAQIRTENRQAKEAIESSLQILKENIEAKGIKVEAVEVRISDFNLADSRNSESSAGEEAKAGSKASKRTGSLSVDGMPETGEEAGEEDIILNPESTVSYRA